MKKLTVFCIALVLAIACARVPLSDRRQFTPLPVAQMVTLGKTTYSQVLQESQVASTSQQAQRVKAVGERIAAVVEEYLRNNNDADRIEGYEWEFSVIESNQLNAWALPGGKVAFYTGILPICKTDDGIATVMAHEIAHSIAHHGNERMSQQLAVQLGGAALQVALRNKPQQTMQLAMTAFGIGSQVGLLLPFSRKHEREADELGLYFMTMAGYDPSAAPDFWQRMMEANSNRQAPPELLSTHPSPYSRVRYLRKLIPEARAFAEDRGYLARY